MKKNLPLLLLCLLLIIACKRSIDTTPVIPQTPSGLRYINVDTVREGQSAISLAPTVQTGGLIPEFEIVSGRKHDGTLLDNTYLQYVAIGGSSVIEKTVDSSLGLSYPDGSLVKTVNAYNSASNGIITLKAGNNFSVGDYYFTIKVTTTYQGVEYTAVFDDAFRIHVAPLLPSNLIYSPKNQNLVYGRSSKTTAPLLPNANTDVSFELGNYTDELVIDQTTGIVSLSPNYVYTKYDTLTPVIKVISNISGETVSFENKLTTIITDKPEVMPTETIYIYIIQHLM
ncbi:MAG: hypothetical protein QM640_04780 [Niabella sp.]